MKVQGNGRVYPAHHPSSVHITAYSLCNHTLTRDALLPYIRNHSSSQMSYEHLPRNILLIHFCTVIYIARYRIVQVCCHCIHTLSSSYPCLTLWPPCLYTKKMPSYSHRVSFLSGFSQSLMWSEITLAAWSAVKLRPIASTKSPSGSIITS